MDIIGRHDNVSQIENELDGQDDLDDDTMPDEC
jgi:hypothetical protein